MTWDELAKEPCTRNQRRALHRCIGLYHDYPDLVAQFTQEQADTLLRVFAAAAKAVEEPENTENFKCRQT